MLVFMLTATLLAVTATAATAASQATDSTRRLAAVRVATQPVLDGRLDDAAWLEAPAASGFWQARPTPGQPETERTEARVLYDDEAIYVGMRAFDHPDSIAAHLTKRDEWGPSDRLHVLLDSWNDRRSAYHFVVNPRGVRLDIYHYNDTQLDMRWNPVWDVVTAIDSLGWTAEFRIPLSQLRFRAHGGAQTWGVNFFREIGRKNEWSTWSPLPADGSALVSAEGLLDGIRALPTPRRLEVMPFVVSSRIAQPVEPGNPFSRPQQAETSFGADLKYGLSSTLTLDLTVNPDFGQLEADPSEVNLTAFESFFEERRPFFIEGAGIFQFPLSYDREHLFYSRRIGRAPQGGANSRGGWASVPPQADLVAAAKLSGQPRPGWSLGALTALTDAARAQVIDSAGARHEDLVEPRTLYSYGRLQRDFRSGRSGLGVIGTAVARDLGEGLSDVLHSRAFTAGVDGRHRFHRDELAVNVKLLGSLVQGTPGAIIRTQSASTRYFQRSDARHVDVDSSLTALGGWASTVSLDKFAGSPLRFGGGVMARSPGFEANDIGLQKRADWAEQYVYTGFVRSRPGRVFRDVSVFANRTAMHTFARERLFNAYSVFTSATLLNFNGFWFNAQRRLPALSNTELRGGPMMATPSRTQAMFAAYTSDQRALFGRAEVSGFADDGTITRSLMIAGSVSWRPTGALALSIRPSVARQVQDAQFVSQASVTATPRWVVGELRQSTLALVGRGDLALTPTLTVQGYVQPFASAGSYSRFREVTRSRAAKYEDRFRDISVQREGEMLEADTDGDSRADLRFEDPGFNSRELRSTVVLRWEFSPGSSLYAVWSHARDGAGTGADLDPVRDMRELFRASSVNALALKVSYWWSP